MCVENIYYSEVRVVKNLMYETPILVIIPVDFSNLKANFRVQIELPLVFPQSDKVNSNLPVQTNCQRQNYVKCKHRCLFGL